MPRSATAHGAVGEAVKKEGVGAVKADAGRC
jgi:hypothetical protein